jgi:plastocyanin
MRRLFSLFTLAVSFVLATNVVLAAPNNQVKTTGDERVVPNAMVQATLKFAPGTSSVTNGAEMTWTHDDMTTAPHTVTIVEEFPAPTLEAIFACAPCAAALAAHSAGGFNPVVEAGGPGLDAPGDSLFFFDDQSISAEVTAPPGTTLRYLCAIHPWMQGQIQVR